MKKQNIGDKITTQGISKSDLESGKIKITVSEAEAKPKKTKNKYPKHPALKRH